MIRAGRPVVLLFLAIVLLTGASPSRGGRALATPDIEHLSWAGDPSTSMAVTWRSERDSAGPYLVEYGSGSGKYPGGQAAASSEPAPGGRGFLHKAELTGLQPDEEYYYRVAGDYGTWGNYYSFKTAPTALPPDGVVFTMNADMGTSSQYPDVGRVVNRVAAEEAAFHLIAGDLTYANLNGGTEIEEYWFSTDLHALASKRPVLVAWGNHEYNPAFDVGIFTISAYFQLPRNGQANACNLFPYYSFRYAGLHVVALDDPASPCFSYERQKAWLGETLAGAAAELTVKWKIVFFHQPPFSSGSNGSQGLNRYMEFDQYGVDLVLTGHNHEYERIWPADWEAGQVEFDYERPRFPTYVVVGTAGAPTSTKRSPPNAWSAFRDEGRNVGFLKVTATERRLAGEFIGKAANRNAEFLVVDRFAITR